MTKKLPVIGTSAATTAFCSAKVEGPRFHLDSDDYLMLDGNGKITWENGTLADPRPNALSLINVDDCPGSTPTCRSSCYVHGIEASAPDTYALYRWNSARLRAVMVGSAWVRREWAYRLARWITDNAAGGFRWHVSGDVFSREYALWISHVCRLSPTVKHWIYTRSFDFVGDLYAPNLAVNLSADRDNLEAAFECAEDWPGTRVCLMVTDVDVCSGDSFAQALGRMRHGDVVFPDYPLRDGTELGREWFAKLPSHLKQMVCPVDRCGKSEERRCGPCDRCLYPVEVIS